MIFDPTANKMVRERTLLFVQDPGSRLQVVRSSETGEWFVRDPWLSTTVLLASVDDAYRASIDETIAVEELTEKLLARCLMMQDRGETLTAESVTPGRHVEAVLRRAFAKVEARGFSSAAVVNAYETLDKLAELVPEIDGLAITDSFAMQPTCIIEPTHAEHPRTAD